MKKKQERGEACQRGFRGRYKILVLMRMKTSCNRGTVTFNGKFLQSNGRFDTFPRHVFCSSSPRLSKTSLLLKIREDSDSWRTAEEEAPKPLLVPTTL